MFGLRMTIQTLPTSFNFGFYIHGWFLSRDFILYLFIDVKIKVKYFRTKNVSAIRSSAFLLFLLLL